MTAEIVGVRGNGSQLHACSESHASVARLECKADRCKGIATKSDGVIGVVVVGGIFDEKIDEFGGAVAECAMCFDDEGNEFSL